MTTTIEAALIQASVGLQPGIRAYGRNESSPDPGSAAGVTGIIVHVHPEDGIWIAPDGLTRKHDAYHFDVEHVVVHLDQQTCGALLRRLAMWAGDDGEAQAYWLVRQPDFCRDVDAPEVGTWSVYARRERSTERLNADFELPLPWPKTTEALATILTHIGLDHRIRRALGEPNPKVGTLAHWDRKTPDDDKPWWCFTPETSDSIGQLAFLEYRAEPWSDAYRHAPYLADITELAPALTAIDAALQAR